MIQIRNVPPATHRKIKARAALEGLSMSDFILREITRIIEQPTLAEVLERLASMPTRELDPSPTQILRSERDGR